MKLDLDVRLVAALQAEKRRIKEEEKERKRLEKERIKREKEERAKNMGKKNFTVKKAEKSSLDQVMLRIVDT